MDKMTGQLQRDTLFRKLRAKPENKVCDISHCPSIDFDVLATVVVRSGHCVHILEIRHTFGCDCMSVQA